MLKPKRLRNLKIDDVSSVDVGAGRGVRVLLHKRHEIGDTATSRAVLERGMRSVLGKHRDGVPRLYGKPLTFGSSADMPDEALSYLKRDYSDDARQEMADSGEAEDDGSYPIKNTTDLHNAIQAIGRSKNPAKTKAHIRRRARALGASDQLPDDWTKRAVPAGSVKKVLGLVNKALIEGIRKNAVDFSEALQASDDVEDAQDLMGDVRDAVCALDCSINSILCDPDVADKATAITESYTQFKTYISGLDFEDDGDTDDTEKRDMPGATDINPKIREYLAEEIAKAVGDKNATIAKLEAEVAYLKMSDRHKAYHDGLGSAADKKKFADMTDDEKDQEMNKRLQRAEDDPIYKSMKVEMESLRKQLDTLQGDKELNIAKADARAMGLTQNDAGEVLMKSRKGDLAAHKTLEGYMVALAKSKRALEDTSKVFVELGTANGNGSGGESAHDQLMAKAAELRQKDPNLTEAQAYTKALTDPANRGLANREQQERMAKIHRVA